MIEKVRPWLRPRAHHKVETQTKSLTSTHRICANVIAGWRLAMTRDAAQQFPKQMLENRKRVKGQILRSGKPKPKVVPGVGGVAPAAAGRPKVGGPAAPRAPASDPEGAVAGT